MKLKLAIYKFLIKIYIYKSINVIKRIYIKVLNKFKNKNKIDLDKKIEEYITVKDAVLEYNLNQSSVYRWIKNNKIKTLNISNNKIKMLFKEDLLKVMNNSKIRRI